MNATIENTGPDRQGRTRGSAPWEGKPYTSSKNKSNKISYRMYVLCVDEVILASLPQKRASQRLSAAAGGLASPEVTKRCLRHTRNCRRSSFYAHWSAIPPASVCCTSQNPNHLTVLIQYWSNLTLLYRSHLSSEPCREKPNQTQELFRFLLKNMKNKYKWDYSPSGLLVTLTPFAVA